MLYKYRSNQNFKNFVDIILNNRLYAAEYKSLNDPMEGLYTYSIFDISRETVNRIKNSKRKNRILSLSKNCNNSLMWSHYADGHRGVVIGVEIVDDNVREEPIIYTEKVYQLDNADIMPQDVAVEILKHKLDFWSYEEEVRILKVNEKFVDVEVKEVILGRVMAPDDERFVTDLIQKINPKIKITKARDDYDRFSISNII